MNTEDEIRVGDWSCSYCARHYNRYDDASLYGPSKEQIVCGAQGCITNPGSLYPDEYIAEEMKIKALIAAGLTV